MSNSSQTLLDATLRSPTTLAAQSLYPQPSLEPAPPVPEFSFDIAIVGLGYVGLPTALAFHELGRRIVGVDISHARLAAIHAGDVDLIDADRERLVKALVDPSGFTVTDDLAKIREAASVIICVPTPIDEHLLPNLSPLAQACRAVVQQARPGQVLMLTSTTYVGCTRELLVRPLADRGLHAGTDVFVAFSPERIDPGNDRVAHHAVPRVVGGTTAACTGRAITALAGSSAQLHPVSSVEAAELTKLYENTFRAVNISLANEFADISSVLDLDITEVIDAAATKPYGFMPFYPGPGVGGHCIPCDPQYLLWQLRARRSTAPVIETAMTAIAARPSRVIQKVTELFATAGRSIAGARVLVVGVTYKPGVSDVRESPALEIIERLREAGADVAFTDDLIATVAVAGEQLYRHPDPAREPWDLVLVHTAHPDSDLGWLIEQPVVLDTTYRLHHVTHRTVL